MGVDMYVMERQNCIIDKRTCTQDIHVDCNNHKENYFVDVRNSVYVRFKFV